MVAAFQEAHGARQNRGHAGGRGDTALGPLQRSKTLLEHAHRRVGEARVDVARLLVRKPRSSLRRRLEHEARREVQRLGMLIELAALDPGAHRQRFRLIWFAHRCVPCMKNGRKKTRISLR